MFFTARSARMEQYVFITTPVKLFNTTISGMIGRPLSTTTSNKTGHETQLFSSEGEAARQKGDYESCSIAWANRFRRCLGGDGLGVDCVLGVRGVGIGPS